MPAGRVRGIEKRSGKIPKYGNLGYGNRWEVEGEAGTISITKMKKSEKRKRRLIGTDLVHVAVLLTLCLADEVPHSLQLLQHALYLGRYALSTQP